MGAMPLDKEIKKYLPLLGTEEKESLLSVIKSFLTLKEKTQHSTLEEYNKELEHAEAHMDAGNSISQDEAEKKADSWF